MSDAAGTIIVRLFAGLESQTRERCITHAYDPREVATVGAAMEALGLAPGAVGLILVNGVHVAPCHALGPGDEVALFPPLGGG
jgi:molybdopterin converting factor small subunit